MHRWAPRSNIRSAGLHRIIWHANRPALSPRSIARIRRGRDARFPGAQVKRNDALRVGFDARDEEEHVIRGFLPDAPGSTKPKANRSPDTAQPLRVPTGAMGTIPRGSKTN
eukprot:scaffold338_cov54-Phaeocystis_antarctica.AAC.1